jgi:hypothetical protein
LRCGLWATSSDFLQPVAELLQQGNGKGTKPKLLERRNLTMALQITATGPIRSEPTRLGASVRALRQRLRTAIVQWARDTFDPYRPELHYMRGPGPRWREKHRMTAPRRGEG